MKVRKSIEIKAPPEKIWPFLVEPEKVLQWYITFKKFEYTGSQKSGVGTPIFIEEHAGGSRMNLHFEATAWEQDSKLALRLVSGTGVKFYNHLWTIEKIPSGSLFTCAEEVGLPLGILGRLIGSFLVKRSEATVDKILLILKTLVES